MNSNLNKISFDDKINSDLNIDSKYVLLTSEINEIKNVVNSLIFESETNVIPFSKCMKFLSVKISKDTFKNLDNYIILLTISSKNDFSDVTFMSSSFSNNFFKFNGNSFETIKQISKLDEELQIFIDLTELNLEEIIENNLEKKYFIKYIFINKDNDKEIKKILSGASLGAYSFTPYLIENIKDIIYNNSNFLNNLIDLKISLSEIDKNKSYEYSLSAEYLNGDIIDITDKKHKIHFLDNGNESFNIENNVITFNNILKGTTKILLIDYIDDNKNRIIKPKQIKLKTEISNLYKDTIPDEFSFDTLYEYDLFHIDINGNEHKITKNSELKIEYPLIKENNNLTLNTIENEETFCYMNYKNVEKLSIINKFVFDDIIFKNTNNNEIYVIDQNDDFDFIPIAVFKNENNEKIEKHINIEDIKIIPNSNICIDINGFHIKNKHPKNDLNETVNIIYKFKNKIYRLEKSFYIKGTNLTNIKILGPDEIDFSLSGEFTTDAFYSNETIKNVVSKYDIYPVNPNYKINYAFDKASNKIILKGDRCVFDKEVIISAYFEEPGFEKFEFDDDVKKINIIADNNSYLSGIIILSDDNMKKIEKHFEASFKNPKSNSENIVTLDTHAINLNLENNWIIGFKDVKIKNEKMFLENFIPEFSNDKKIFKKEFIFNEKLNSYIIKDGIPEKFNNFKKLKITFSFDPEELI